MKIMHPFLPFLVRSFVFVGAQECITIVMSDKGGPRGQGDGWQGAVLNVSDARDGIAVFTGSLDARRSATEQLCLSDGCYLVSVSEDENPDEVDFGIFGTSDEADDYWCEAGRCSPFGPCPFLVSGGDVIVWGSCETSAPTAASAPAFLASGGGDGSCALSASPSTKPSAMIGTLVLVATIHLSISS